MHACSHSKKTSELKIHCWWKKEKFKFGRPFDRSVGQVYFMYVHEMYYVDSRYFSTGHGSFVWAFNSKDQTEYHPYQLFYETLYVFIFSVATSARQLDDWNI